MGCQKQEGEESLGPQPKVHSDAWDQHHSQNHWGVPKQVWASKILLSLRPQDYLILVLWIYRHEKLLETSKEKVLSLNAKSVWNCKLFFDLQSPV